MIPSKHITHWRQYAPWIFQSQVEQDLVLSRALVLLFQQPVIQETLAFRGGTALNKLYCDSLARYSEDIDLVQIRDEPIGEVMGAIRDAIDPWLEKASWKQTARSVKFIYRFNSEDIPFFDAVVLFVDDYPRLASGEIEGFLDPVVIVLSELL